MILLRLKTICHFLILSILALSLLTPCHADTVYLKRGSALKGIVAEDYVDRIVYSTVDGEREILKSDILEIKYDEPIDNLVHLGDSAFKKGYYRVALRYYLMAQEINPGIKALNDKILHTETTIYKTPEIQKRERLAIKNEIISGRIIEKHAEAFDEKSVNEKLKKEFGVYISRKADGKFLIERVRNNSSFKKTGARKNDIIIAVWSKFCTYLSLEQFYKILSNPHESMINLTIERDVRLNGKTPMGAKLIMKWEGTVVESLLETGEAKKAGLKKGDIIAAIDKQSIRYTSLNTILKWTEKEGAKTITIHRKLTVFKTD